MKIRSIISNITEKKLKSNDPCWNEYRQFGTKTKNGKEVPNCVPNESVDDEFMRDQGGSGSAAARGSVKKINKSGRASWWAKNRAGTMKIFDNEQKANRFAMTNESVEDSQLFERVEIDHSRYLRSHGKKARGAGMWMFTSKGMGEPKGDEIVTINGDLSGAAKEAAKKLGTNRVYVMEEVELDEAQNALVGKYMNKSGSNTLYVEIWKKLPSGNYYHTISNQHGINISASAIDLKSNHAEAKKKVDRVSQYYDQDGDVGALKFLNSMLPGWKKAPLRESVDLTEDVHNDLNDTIIDFQRKLMRMTRQLDPAIAKEVKKIDKDLDNLRTGPLFNIRPGR
jgi:hypothetical protein